MMTASEPVPVPEIKLPTMEEFFLKTGLYDPLDVGNLAGDVPSHVDIFLRRVRTLTLQFDAYCIWCKKPSTFTVHRTEIKRPPGAIFNPPQLVPGIFQVDVTCARNANHKYSYVLMLRGNELQKIGQFPSIESIASSDVEKFRGVLGSKYFSELHRAGGLFSHSIGIGSFVYLRRIFERLIYKTKDVAQAAGVNVDGFDQLRMDQKIELLRAYLPPALVKNRAVYKILSKGIHELEEESCLKYFPSMRAAIIGILEQDLHVEEKRLAEKVLEDEIGKIHDEIVAGTL